MFFCFVFYNETASHAKCTFLTKCNSCRITVQWFHIKRYSDILYTKKSAVYFQCKDCFFFFLFLFFFARYVNSAPRLILIFLMYVAECVKITCEINRFTAFSHFVWSYIGCLPCRDKNSFRPTLISCEQILTFNLCKTFNLYAHFSAERWEYKLKVDKFYKFSNFAYSTKVISLDQR